MRAARRYGPFAAALARGVPPLVWVHGDEPLLVHGGSATRSRQALRAAGLRRTAGVRRRSRVSARRAASPRPARCRCSPAGADRTAPDRQADRRSSGRRSPTPLPGIVDEHAAAGVGPRLDRAATESALVRAPSIGSRWWCRSARSSARSCRSGSAQRLAPPAPARRRARRWRLIAERVEGNLLAAHQEIRKLGAAVSRGRAAGRARCAHAVLDVARYDAFDLVDAMLAGDAAARAAQPRRAARPRATPSRWCCGRSPTRSAPAQAGRGARRRPAAGAGDARARVFGAARAPVRAGAAAPRRPRAARAPRCRWPPGSIE